MKIEKYSLTYKDKSYPSVKATIEETDNYLHYPIGSIQIYADQALWNDIEKDGITYDFIPTNEEGNKLDDTIFDYLPHRVCERFCNGEMTEKETKAALEEYRIRYWKAVDRETGNETDFMKDYSNDIISEIIRRDNLT